MPASVERRSGCLSQTTCGGVDGLACKRCLRCINRKHPRRHRPPCFSFTGLLGANRSKRSKVAVFCTRELLREMFASISKLPSLANACETQIWLPLTDLGSKVAVFRTRELLRDILASVSKLPSLANECGTQIWLPLTDLARGARQLCFVQDNCSERCWHQFPSFLALPTRVEHRSDCLSQT